MCQIDPYAAIHDNLLLALCADPARATRGRDTLLTLPRGWLLSRIAAVADPMLEAAGADEWNRLLALYRDLDAALADDLARRAAAHADAAIASLAGPLLEPDPRRC